jgi:hypothetical protein
LRNAAHYFPQTSWTLIEAIRGGGDAAAPALAELASRYYRPAYAYITAILRDQGMLLGPDQTEELTQAFFTLTVVSGRLLSRVDRARARGPAAGSGLGDQSPQGGPVRHFWV